MQKIKKTIKIKHMKTLIVSIMLLLCAPGLYAQKKIAEGIVTYSVEWELPESMKNMANNFPAEIKVYFKGDSSSTRTESQMYSSNSILNATTNFERLLVDIPILNKKYVVTLKAADQKKMSEKLPKLELVRSGTETKMMAGYKVYKFSAVERKSNQHFEAWFTNDINITPNALTRFYDTSYGFPVQFTTYVNGITLKAMVKEVKSSLIPPKSFVADSDYVEISLEQLMQMSGGN